MEQPADSCDFMAQPGGISWAAAKISGSRVTVFKFASAMRC
jgi:hypothetical protein